MLISDENGKATSNFGEEMFGALTYQIFNDTEFLPFTYAYLNDHQMQSAVTKAGSNNYTESAIFKPQVTSIWQKDSEM